MKKQDEAPEAKLARAKPGRKPLAVRRDKYLNIRITSEQFAHIETLAAAAGMTKTDYVVSLIPDMPKT